MSSVHLGLTIIYGTQYTTLLCCSSILNSKLGCISRYRRVFSRWATALKELRRGMKSGQGSLFNILHNKMATISHRHRGLHCNAIGLLIHLPLKDRKVAPNTRSEGPQCHPLCMRSVLFTIAREGSFSIVCDGLPELPGLLVCMWLHIKWR